MIEPNKTIVLKRSNPNRDDMWELRNSHGDAITYPQHFLNKDDAVAWANRFVSSWVGVMLRIED